MCLGGSRRNLNLHKFILLGCRAPNIFSVKRMCVPDSGIIFIYSNQDMTINWCSTLSIPRPSTAAMALNVSRFFYFFFSLIISLTEWKTNSIQPFHEQTKHVHRHWCVYINQNESSSTSSSIWHGLCAIRNRKMMSELNWSARAMRVWALLWFRQT